jgi:hypothetical protein
LLQVKCRVLLFYYHVHNRKTLYCGYLESKMLRRQSNIPENVIPRLSTGGDSGGGAPPAPPPPLKWEKIWFFGVKSWFFTRNTSTIFAPPSAIEKIWFFGVKSWFFTRNTPKIFEPPSARRNFFKCAPPNLKSWIRPWSRE